MSATRVGDIFAAASATLPWPTKTSRAMPIAAKMLLRTRAILSGVIQIAAMARPPQNNPENVVCLVVHEQGSAR